MCYSAVQEIHDPGYRLNSTSYSISPDNRKLEDHPSTAGLKDSMNGYAGVYEYSPTIPYNQIILLTTPVSTLKKLGIKKPIDIVAHWTICINGWCYELARRVNNKKSPYYYRTMTYQQWELKRAEQRKPIEQHSIGHLAWPYSHALIDEVASLVWERSLNMKYAYDEHNCQVFVRLLIELIGSRDAKVGFPAALDRWVKGAGNARDRSFFAFAAGASVFAAGVCSIAVDPTGTTAAAGFALAAQLTLRSTANLLTDRAARGVKIEEGQKEIRKVMRERGRPLAEPEAKR